jgi:hypothetical protein
MRSRRLAASALISLLLTAPWHVSAAQGSMNGWPRSEQESAARIPLNVTVLDRVERAIRALDALARREPAYCRWVGNAAESSSIAAEAAGIGQHAGVRTALAAGSLTPREFVELSFALLMAGITHESRQNNIAAPSPTAPAANVTFFVANQARIERVLALDPC